MLLDIYVVARGPERHALWIALTLGLVSQAIASTAIINYAPQLLEKTGLKSNSVSTLLSAIVPAAKVRPMAFEPRLQPQPQLIP